VVLDDVDLDDTTLDRLHAAMTAVPDRPDRSLESLLLLLDAVLLVRQPEWSACVLEREDHAYLVSFRRR
jgi:hypothetical protein